MTPPLEDLAEAEAGVPDEIKRELLECATANGSISYHYLLKLYKRGAPGSTAAAPFGIWQPMATAPKDADLILVYSAAIGVQLATWLGPDDGSVSLAGWGPWGDADGRWSLRPDEQPSHWMPLPAPPSSTRDET